MRLSDAASDVTKEEEGTWVPIQDDFEVKVRSTNSKKYRRLQQRHFMANRRFYAQKKQPPEDVLMRQAIDLVVNSLLVDWRGIETDDEPPQPIVFDHDVAKTILGDAQFLDILNSIADAAGEREHFRAKAAEEDAKN